MSRERILKTAQKIFAKKGYDRATTQEIADRARVNKAMIYYYFKNKENLYLEVVRNFFSKITSLFSDVSSTELAPPEKLKLFVSEYIDIISQNREMPSFILQSLLSRKKKVLLTIRDIITPLYKNAFLLFQEGREKGYFRDLDFANVGSTMVGSIVFYFVSSPLFSLLIGIDPLSGQNLKKKKEEIIKLLEHGLVKTESINPAKEGAK